MSKEHQSDTPAAASQRGQGDDHQAAGARISAHGPHPLMSAPAASVAHVHRSIFSMHRSIKKIHACTSKVHRSARKQQEWMCPSSRMYVQRFPVDRNTYTDELQAGTREPQRCTRAAPRVHRSIPGDTSLHRKHPCVRADRTAIDPTATVASEAGHHHHDAGVPCGRLRPDHAHAGTDSSPDSASGPVRYNLAFSFMGERGAGQGGNLFRDVLLPVTSKWFLLKRRFDDVPSRKRLI